MKAYEYNGHNSLRGTTKTDPRIYFIFQYHSDQFILFLIPQSTSCKSIIRILFSLWSLSLPSISLPLISLSSSLPPISLYLPLISLPPISLPLISLSLPPIYIPLFSLSLPLISLYLLSHSSLSLLSLSLSPSSLPPIFLLLFSLSLFIFLSRWVLWSDVW